MISAITLSGVALEKELIYQLWLFLVLSPSLFLSFYLCPCHEQSAEMDSLPKKKQFKQYCPSLFS